MGAQILPGKERGGKKKGRNDINKNTREKRGRRAKLFPERARQ